jgi:hypothetical protein
MKKRSDRPRQHATYAVDLTTGETVDDGLERRQHQRLPIAWEGTIHDGSREIPGTIANISASGALVIAVHELAIDTVVILHIDPFGHLPSRVVWVESDRCGLKFLDTPQRVAQRLGLAKLIQHSGNIEFIPF